MRGSINDRNKIEFKILVEIFSAGDAWAQRNVLPNVFLSIFL